VRPELRAWIDQQADAERLSTSAWVRRLLEDAAKVDLIKRQESTGDGEAA
jgi:hypothetical protein